MARKPTETVGLHLRFSESLRRRLEREAARHRWSMNAEIVDRLEQSFHLPDQATAIEKAIEQAIFKHAAKTTEKG